MTQTDVILISTVFVIAMTIGVSRLPTQEVSHVSRPQSVQSHDAPSRKALPILRARQKAGIRMICFGALHTKSAVQNS